MSQLYLTTFYNCIQGTKKLHHTSAFWPLFGAVKCKFGHCILHIVPSAQFGTINHIQSLHKFPYIYPIFFLLMSYNTLYFYLKVPIDYPIFCSEYACRPVEDCLMKTGSVFQIIVPVYLTDLIPY